MNPEIFNTENMYFLFEGNIYSYFHGDTKELLMSLDYPIIRFYVFGWDSEQKILAIDSIYRTHVYYTETRKPVIDMNETEKSLFDDEEE